MLWDSGRKCALHVFLSGEADQLDWMTWKDSSNAILVLSEGEISAKKQKNPAHENRNSSASEAVLQKELVEKSRHSLVAQTVKVSAYDAGDLDWIPGSGRSSGEGNGNPLQYSCLENPMDGRAWWATVYGVTKSRTWLSDSLSTESESRPLKIINGQPKCITHYVPGKDNRINEIIRPDSAPWGIPTLWDFGKASGGDSTYLDEP